MSEHQQGIALTPEQMQELVQLLRTIPSDTDAVYRISRCGDCGATAAHYPGCASRDVLALRSAPTRTTPKDPNG